MDHLPRPLVFEREVKMNREVKFRIWNHSSSEMMLWERIQPYYVLEVFDNDHFTTMQYTGLKDKNGQEIYEGDIVEHNCGVKALTRFDQGVFFFESLRDIFSDNIFSYSKTVKVVGNKFEDPDLLEEIE